MNGNLIITKAKKKECENWYHQELPMLIDYKIEGNYLVAKIDVIYRTPMPEQLSGMSGGLLILKSQVRSLPLAPKMKTKQGNSRRLVSVSSAKRLLAMREREAARKNRITKHKKDNKQVLQK